MTYPLTSLAVPVARLLLSFMFIMSGWTKIGGYAATAGYMASKGVPAGLLPLVIAVELVGGLMILFGVYARIVSILLAGFCVISAVLFHYDPANQGQMINFMKNLTIAGGFLMIYAHGAGAYSVDAWRKKA
ncbi:DoxX family protein [Methyloraptor flagellatus]|uniref:DoxX family protein n=1 Tax=Methyloraptor flagellatus TaxID=3162530 RepID=A0AAU7XDT4_9HYPH